MQDKDFDRLFKDHLKDAQLVPSADLWSKIEHKMVPEKKASLPYFWIAASVAVMLMVAGVLFTKTEKVRLQGSVPLQAAIAHPQTDPVVESGVSDQVEIHEGTPLVIAPTFEVNYTENEPLENKVSASMQPKQEDTRLDDKVIARTEPAKNEDWKLDTQVIASSGHETTLPDAVVNENERVERRGFRNVGDIVNFVVEKVDKREEKLLKFNTDDDDNSSLVAINIGFIKLNSKKHK